MSRSESSSDLAAKAVFGLSGLAVRSKATNDLAASPAGRAVSPPSTMRTFLFTLLLFSIFACDQSPQRETADAVKLTSYVNPFIGTDGKGKTYPGATVPFGMVQLSPDNGRSGWDWISGYFYPDTTIAGFSHTHLTGTGAGDMYDISMMPVTYPIKTDTSFDGATYPVPYSTFSHDKEHAEPGYYQVMLQDYGIQAELTATRRCGFHRYTFPAIDSAAIILDLGYTRNWDFATETYLRVIDDSTVVGHRFSDGFAKGQKVFFCARFSRPFKAIVYEGQTSLGPYTGAGMVGRASKAYFHYEDLEVGEEVLVKVGISSASIEGAELNLKVEIKDWDFEGVKAAASAVWEKELQKIKVTTTDDSLREIFYTAMYQALLAPTLYSDIDGGFKSTDGSVRQAKDYDRYSTFSFWDTFRAAHPFYTLVQRERMKDVFRSMMEHYRETGLLPEWVLAEDKVVIMIGYHAVPILTDAWFKGLLEGITTGEELLTAFQASANQPAKGLEDYKAHGYIPQDKVKESVSKTLEYAYDDACIALLAKELGEKEVADEYAVRAHFPQNLFDSKTGFMRARNSDGVFAEPFDPLTYNDEYIEGNAWQYTWFMPHDVPFLIEGMGGNEAFVQKLDALFSTETPTEDLPVFITGLIGQYVHGNEPGHHIPYLYNYAGAPWKSQEICHRITKKMHTAMPDGICGNEDCGQMSAWFILSSLGFYPVDPALGVYAIGSPRFERAVIDLSEGKQFEIVANGVSDKNIYIQSATLNGENWENNYLFHKDIMAGGKLVFQMGPNPNQTRGTSPENAPPAFARASHND